MTSTSCIKCKELFGVLNMTFKTLEFVVFIGLNFNIQFKTNVHEVILRSGKINTVTLLTKGL